MIRVSVNLGHKEIASGTAQAAKAGDDRPLAVIGFSRSLPLIVNSGNYKRAHGGDIDGHSFAC